MVLKTIKTSYDNTQPALCQALLHRSTDYTPQITKTDEIM
jgi:hypothetical protein